MSERERGTIKWFNADSGYGFIVPDSGGKDVFVHIKNVEGTDTLKEGQALTFLREEGTKGFKALEVRLAE